MEENNEVVEEVVEEEAPSIGDELRDAIAAAEEPSEDTVDEPDGAKTETPQEIPEKEAGPAMPPMDPGMGGLGGMM